MTESGAAHAIFGVKHYDPETGALLEADIYAPAVLLDEDEFTERTDAQVQKSPRLPDPRTPRQNLTYRLHSGHLRRAAPDNKATRPQPHTGHNKNRRYAHVRA